VDCGNSWGSGVIIHENYILTNNHVCKNAEAIEVQFYGKRQQAHVVAISTGCFDLALL